MPERLDQVTVRLTRSDVPLPWTSRDALLDRLGRHPLGEHDADRSVRKAFEDVGATRPVTLTLNEKGHLLKLLEAWTLEVGRDELPGAIFDLRNVLHDDLHDAAERT